MDRTRFEQLIQNPDIGIFYSDVVTIKRAPAPIGDRLPHVPTAAKRPFGIRITKGNAAHPAPLLEIKRSNLFSTRHTWKTLPRKRPRANARAVHSTRHGTDDLLRSLEMQPTKARNLSAAWVEKVRVSLPAASAAEQSRPAPSPKAVPRQVGNSAKTAASEWEKRRYDRLIAKLNDATQVGFGVTIALWVLHSVLLLVFALEGITGWGIVAGSLLFLWTAMLVQRLTVAVPLPSAQTMAYNGVITVLTIVLIFVYKTDIVWSVLSTLFMGALFIVSVLGRKAQHTAYLYSVVPIVGMFLTCGLAPALGAILSAAVCVFGIVCKEAVLRWRIEGDLNSVKTVRAIFILILIVAPLIALLVTVYRIRIKASDGKPRGTVTKNDDSGAESKKEGAGLHFELKFDLRTTLCRNLFGNPKKRLRQGAVGGILDGEVRHERGRTVCGDIRRGGKNPVRTGGKLRPDRRSRRRAALRPSGRLGAAR